MSSALLECAGLAFARDDRPLFTGVGFCLAPGAALEIRGANGAGKTTLLRILAGLLTPSAGRVCWRGRDIRRARRAYLAEMLYLGHDSAVKEALTPRENLTWFLGLRGAARTSIAEALARAGLEGLGDVPCRALSAGQRRRVALARLWLVPAALWILDEPFTAVDVDGVAAFRAALAAHRDGGGAVVITSHQTLDLPQLEILELARHAPR
ncbi:MAG: cytochrome c biogenesis ATP-binding export protein CcmA [Porticoccaceae bacterium]|nr:MAG: cytochrome c biogenesis ATP-binding export protein CcmA [Porticoccaceae bacterium]